MNIHKNARLTPHSRATLVRRVIEEGHRDARVIRPCRVGQRATMSDQIAGVFRHGLGTFLTSPRASCRMRDESSKRKATLGRK
ncbi:MAG: leucine zipper domain-containing protein [Minwuia sp.]|nr:leucine zipper domain-containing protein [Minwuia sp.]